MRLNYPLISTYPIKANQDVNDIFQISNIEISISNIDIFYYLNI